MPDLDRRWFRSPSVLVSNSGVPERRTIRSGLTLADASAGGDHADADLEDSTDGTPESAVELRPDGSGPAASDGVDSGEPPVAFVDCETVRISGEFADVILSLFWWDAAGRVGTIAEPVGGVDGERTILASDEFGNFAYGPIVSGVDGYREGAPVVPGGGDVSVANPDVESCVESVRGSAGAEVELEVPFPE